MSALAPDLREKLADRLTDYEISIPVDLVKAAETGTIGVAVQAESIVDAVETVIVAALRSAWFAGHAAESAKDNPYPAES